METAAVLRSIRGAMLTTQSLEPVLEKTVPVQICNVASKTHKFSGVSVARFGRKELFLPYLRASQNSSALTSNEVNTDKKSVGPLDSQSVQKSTFPSGFEALLSEVCDETSIAEVKIKVGNFELHLKRDIGIPKASPPTIASPTTAPPIPSEPMNEAAPAAQTTVPSKTPAAATNTFANLSSAKASKLAVLEASGLNAYVTISSPTVGTFQRGRTLKGKRQPPSCKEGDLIKEGQTIGFINQFGSELPVKSNVAGEILKVLYEDGEPVGYGDPLVTLFPRAFYYLARGKSHAM